MKHAFLLCLLLPLALGTMAESQTPAARPLPVRPIPALVQALQKLPAASVGDGNVVLMVVSPALLMPQAPLPQAEAALPPGEEATPPDDSVPTPENITARYKRVGGWFAHVYALAPPTMTVLNTSPTLADLPLSVLAAQHPTPFLIGSLTAEQLRQMAASGLAYSDLTPDQQGLLQAMLPHPFQVVPAALQPPKGVDFQKAGADTDALIKQQKALNDAYQAQWRTTPDAALPATLRLHGFLTTEFAFDSPGGASIGERASDDGLGTTGPYKLTNGGRTEMFLPGGSRLQSTLRTETPNVPKDGDLRWTRRDLARTLALGGLKTVDDLVARIAGATHLELYADARYGALPLMVVGEWKKPQPAADVMQALALCVCGAWRQVGPAYVLTDDVQGLGTRQAFLHEMVQVWSNRLSESGKAVGGHLRDLDWMHALRFADSDAGALSSGQVDALGKGKANYGTLPWKDLPVPLQAALRGQLTRHFDGDNMASFEQAGKSIAQALKPDFPISTTINLQLAVSLPDTGAMALGDAYRVQIPREDPAPSTGPPPAQAGSVSVDKPLRGILCAPKTPDEARAVVAKLPKMGLNALFLDVFTNGRTYFPNTALAPETDKAAGVLQAALKAANAGHIPVYAVLDTLCWRKDGASPHSKPWPADYGEDLTIGSEASDHAVQREMADHSIRADFDREYEMADKGNQSWASPLDPKVRTLLPALVRGLAAINGLAGIVFQDTAAVGYRGIAHEYDDEGISLGYMPQNRLAYLRAYHADPVDLSSGFDSLSLWLPTEGFQTQFEVSISSFPSFSGSASDTWGIIRSDADKGLLADCYAAVRSTAPALPLFMRERQAGATLDPWLDPKKLNQYATLNTLDYPFRAITPRSILVMPYGPVESTHPERFVWEVNSGYMTGDEGKRAGGLVFDLVTGYTAESLLDRLERLTQFLKKPPLVGRTQ